MDKPVEDNLTPHRLFSKERWSDLNTGMTLPLSLQDLRRLRSLNDPISLMEVEQVYLPISKILSMHVEAAKTLYDRRAKLLNVTDGEKTPFIIGIAGSVAVGKSTTARILQTMLSRWGSTPKVDLVTTDGFLYPNNVLEAENLMQRKGFPESYDLPKLLRFLHDIKAGHKGVRAPIYSHFTYDVIPDDEVIVDRPDILILEGLNVLQTRALPKEGDAVPFVSDYFDFSIYIDADEDRIQQWYLERFMKLRETAFKEEGSYFNHVAKMSDDEAIALANHLWQTINRVNLTENIRPTKPRADLILRKSDSHLVETVQLRRL